MFFLGIGKLFPGMPGDPDTPVEISNFHSLKREKNNDKKASICNTFIRLLYHILISSAAICDVTTEIISNQAPGRHATKTAPDISTSYGFRLPADSGGGC